MMKIIMIIMIIACGGYYTRYGGERGSETLLLLFAFDTHTQSIGTQVC